MFITPNMGLTAWDQGADNYDHSQLAANISAIDSHNHTPGHGLQVPTDGIANNAITAAKIAGNAVVPLTHISPDSIPQSRLATDSVGNDELQDNAVAAANILNGSVTAAKLDPTILPIGMVAMWYRADPSVLPPTGWQVMDGRAWSTITNKLGAGGIQWNTGNIPDMTNRFPLGSALAGTGGTPDLPPGIGQAIGQHTRDLSHTHTSDAHSHVVNNHAHGIDPDGSHKHYFQSIFPLPGGGTGTGQNDLRTRDVGVPRAEGTRQALYVPALNQNGFLGGDVDAPMLPTGLHSHGSATGSNSAGTNAVAVNINTALVGDQDLRPASVGLLFIMKVV